MLRAHEDFRQTFHVMKQLHGEPQVEYMSKVWAVN
jgi:hypothetical protein